MKNLPTTHDRVMRRLHCTKLRMTLIAVLSKGDYSVTIDTLNRLVYLINKAITDYENFDTSSKVALHQFRRIYKILNRKILIENITVN